LISLNPSGGDCVDCIPIAVSPIVSDDTFALAQERLDANKTHAPRRAITPSVVQGFVS
jgi:site-specific DNA recombinase